MTQTRFLSDLHLTPGRPEVTRRFLRYLESCGGHCDALYILGDLFEAWIGDDDDDPLPGEVVRGLRGCTEAGTRVLILRGNRDFLLGKRFSTASGCALLDDPVRVDLCGQPALLMHGDTLCSGDTDYLALRRRLRDPDWQRDFLARPLEERRRLAAELRNASRAAGESGAAGHVDVSPDAVVETMRSHGVRLLIHGHTHRQAMHSLAVDREAARRISLGSWESDGNFLEYACGAFHFVHFHDAHDA